MAGGQWGAWNSHLPQRWWIFVQPSLWQSHRFARINKASRARPGLVSCFNTKGGDLESLHFCPELTKALACLGHESRWSRNGTKRTSTEGTGWIIRVGSGILSYFYFIVGGDGNYGNTKVGSSRRRNTAVRFGKPSIIIFFLYYDSKMMRDNGKATYTRDTETFKPKSCNRAVSRRSKTKDVTDRCLSRVTRNFPSLNFKSIYLPIYNLFVSIFYYLSMIYLYLLSTYHLYYVLSIISLSLSMACLYLSSTYLWSIHTYHLFPSVICLYLWSIYIYHLSNYWSSLSSVSPYIYDLFVSII